jgi:predicted dehydrogenase
MRFGIIGLGHWGPNHLRTFNSIPDCEVVAAADQSSARIDRLRASAPKASWYSSHEQLLADPDVDAVVVATPTKTHFAIVEAALRSGKHVLCEKPLCTDSREGEQLVALAKEQGLILMVGHIFLFNSGILKVKELINGGSIGSLRYISAARTNLGPVRSDVNAAYDLASHDIAVFNWITGSEPIEVQAMGAAFLQPGVEDVAVITLRYPGNILASIQCSWLDPKKVRQMTFVGSRKMVCWDDLALSNPVAVYDKSVESNREVTDYGDHLRLSMFDGDVHLPKVATDEPLKAQAIAFQKAVREGRADRSDGAFAVGVVRVLELIEAALKRTTNQARTTGA